jgi:hypothetical protein
MPALPMKLAASSRRTSLANSASLNPAFGQHRPEPVVSSGAAFSSAGPRPAGSNALASPR